MRRFWINAAASSLALTFLASNCDAQVNYSVQNPAARTSRSAVNNDVRPGYLWGRVRDVHNQPVGNAPVVLAKAENGRVAGPPIIRTMTDGRGAYYLNIEGLQPGEYVEFVNPGPSMAGENLGGSRFIQIDNPRAGHHENDFVLSRTPPTGVGQPG